MATKHNSKVVYADGYKFDSKAEYKYYLYLLTQVKQKNVQSFRIHPTYELIPKYVYQGKNKRAITYSADFEYITAAGDTVIVDIKGFETQPSVIRRKLFEYTYPDKNLIWLSESQKYGGGIGFIDTDELKKIRKENKKNVGKRA